MKLPENEVHVWYFSVDDFSHGIDIYRRFLSMEEIGKSNKFKFEKDRILNTLTRSSLRILSGLYLDSEPNAIEFKYGDFGKPAYNFPTDVKFNVSHSGKFIVLAFVKDSEIGVDVEKIKTDFNVLKIAENFFSTSEIELLHNVEPDNLYKAFYRCWTRKESFIKAKGSGLSFPLTSFTVSVNHKEPKLLRTEWNPLEKEQWNLFSFDPASGYVGALSVAKKIQSVKYFDQRAFLSIIDSIRGLA